VIASQPDPVEFGTDGDDVVVVTSDEPFRLDGLGGDDTICAGAHTDVNGGDGNDTIELALEQGPAIVHGGAGDDVLDGGPEDDLLQGEEGNDTIKGGGGDDTSSGGSGDDTIHGNAGNDFLGGGVVDGPIPDPQTQSDAAAGHDVVDGGAGNDHIVDSDSDEELAGGSGTDTLSLWPEWFDDPDYCGGFTGSQTPVVDAGKQSVTGLGSDTFNGFESYQGGGYHQTLIGSTAAETFRDNLCGTTTIDARGGADTITSESCDVTVIAGRGPDSLFVDGTGHISGNRGDDVVTLFRGEDFECGPGATSLHGGPGTDGLVIAAGRASEFPIVDLAQHFAGTARRSGRVRLHGVENVTQRDNRGIRPVPGLLIGDAGPNLLVGNRARTVLHGRGGNDHLLGGRGPDTAYGGAGHDVCRAELRRDCEAR
jgi:Ca2+-binding RTX toxin-like protein